MVLFVKCLAFFCVTNIRLAITAPMMTNSKTMNYLNKYGYMKGDSKDMSDGLKKFQHMMKMDTTGLMDKRTSDAMQAPRCGMRDMTGDKLIKAYGWKKNHLTYKINNNPHPVRSHISPSNIKSAIKEAFKMWTAVADLEITQESENSNVDIDISFLKGVHLRHHDKFDGPAPAGMELGHALKPTLPDENLRGDVHFDDDEKWVLNPSEPNFKEGEFNLFYVAVHEIGHALGLTHGDKDSIMGPLYKNTTEVRLHPKDIKGIQGLYSPRIGSNPKSRFLGIDICADPRIDAAFTTVGSTYVVKENYCWKLTATGLPKGSSGVEMSTMWPNAPVKIDAAFTNAEKSKTFFFNGSYVSRYDRFRQNAPGNMKTWFGLDLDSVDAVMKGDDGQPTYFFKGKMFYKKTGPDLSSGLIADKFKGVPNDLDAAVIYKRKANQPPDPVFFKGDKCYYRRYSTSSTPGKTGQFTDEYVEVETKNLFGCSL